MFLTIKTTTQTKTSSWEWGPFDPEDLDKDQKAVRAKCDLSPLNCRQIVQDIQDGKKILYFTKVVNLYKKIPHTGDTESLDRCG